jgi:histidyl-tRNA synthetase
MADKTPRRPRAETPKGFRDYFGAEVTERKAMLDASPESTTGTGSTRWRPLRWRRSRPSASSSPTSTARMRASLPGRMRTADWLALRYDLTAPLARVAAQYRNDLPSPLPQVRDGPRLAERETRSGKVPPVLPVRRGYGGLRLGRRRCRNLRDAGRCLEEVGIPRGDYVVKVNNRKVLNGVMEVAGLAGDDKEAERGIVLRAIDKIDRLGPEGVRALLGEGRKDESGDFTKGAGLNAGTGRGRDGLHQRQARHGGRLRWPGCGEWSGRPVIGAEGWRSWKGSPTLLEAQGYGPDRIVIDPGVVRGLGYYTGPVYEAELTFEILDEKGRKRQFGSVAGGGRYDGLVKRFTGQDVPATGVSIGVDRLLGRPARQGAQHGGYGGAGGRHRDGPRPDGRLHGDGRGTAAGGHPGRGLSGQPEELRQPVEIRRQAVVPGGGDPGRERGREGTVILKDLILGAKIAESATLEEWKDRPAQVEVPRAEMVAAVRKMLGQ